MSEKVAIFRSEHFNAAHRLFNPRWTDEENEKVFSKCSNKNFHGHNYEVQVKLSGEVNADTGFVFDLNQLSLLMQKQIVERFDHKNLNLDCEEFKNCIPTAENMVIVMYNILRPLLPNSLQLQVRLYETQRNFVEYPI